MSYLGDRGNCQNENGCVISPSPSQRSSLGYSAMSKAFTRESDDEGDALDIVRQPSSLPPGVKNYITPQGARRLQEEMQHLVEVERPLWAGKGSDAVARQRVQRVDQQIAALDAIHRSLMVVDPPPPPWEQVKFGAVVSVKNRKGETLEYRIVGVEETDVDQGRVSWLAPIARALLNARVGQTVPFRFPSGEEALEILSVTYGE